MAFGVVDCLETVNIHACGDQLSIAPIGPGRSSLLNIGEPRTPAARSGQRIDFVGLALRRGPDAVLGGR